MTVNLKQIADLVSGEVLGDPSTVVSGVSSITEARPGDLVFADSVKNLSAAENSAAAAVLTRHQTENGMKPMVVVPDPRVAFATVLGLFAPKIHAKPGVDPTVHVGEGVQISESACVGFCAYIGDNVVLGDSVAVLPHAYVGDGVTIDEGSVIYPNVTIYPGCRIGRNVIIHSGVVIGADGFGYNYSGGKHQKVPHIGGVIIHDDVEIGSNTTIDRARTGFTEIGAGTKIDNMVHVAHNVKIGRNCVVVAQVGISGSVTIGNGVVLAGQVGIKDNVSVGDGAQIGARSGLISDIPAGAKIAGFPARPYGEEMRIWASIGRLPELVKQVKSLEAKLARLEKKLENEQEE